MDYRPIPVTLVPLVRLCERLPYWGDLNHLADHWVATAGALVLAQKDGVLIDGAEFNELRGKPQRWWVPEPWFENTVRELAGTESGTG
jgi:hypothetical protein